MAFSDALKEYLKCYECEKFADCPDVDNKLNEALKKPAFIFPNYTNPLRPFTPYKSKYFDDHRFDPPRELTADDILCAMERMKNI